MITQSATYTVSNVSDAETLLGKLWTDDKIYCYYNLHKDIFDHCVLAKSSPKVVTEFSYEMGRYSKFSDNIGMFIWILKNYNIVYVTNRKLRYLPFYKYNKFNTFRNIYTINKFIDYIPSITVSTDSTVHTFDTLRDYLDERETLSI